MKRDVFSFGSPDQYPDGLDPAAQERKGGALIPGIAISGRF